MLAPFAPNRIPHLAEWYAEGCLSATAQLIADGVAPETVRVSAFLDARYQGQGFELTLPLPGWRQEDLARVPELFHAAHEELYGHGNRGEPVELVTLRVQAVGAFPQSAAAAQDSPEQAAEHPEPIARPTIRIPGLDPARVAIYERSRLRPGQASTAPRSCSRWTRRQ